MTSPSAPQSTTSHGFTVRFDDLELYYEDYGTGEPLVLLHGFGGCGQNWRAFAAPLAERYRLIVMDLRGHGHSSNPATTFTHCQAADDVLRVLDGLGIEHFSAMGMSTGGMVLLHLATRQPARVDAVVLVSATSHFPEQARAIMRGVTFERMPLPVQEMYSECAKRGDAQIRLLIAQFNALAANYDDVNFTADVLSTITARTLIVHGDRDRFFPVEIALDLYRFIPDAALWIVPYGEHVPIYDPAVPFVATALRFLVGA